MEARKEKRVIPRLLHPLALVPHQDPTDHTGHGPDLGLSLGPQDAQSRVAEEDLPLPTPVLGPLVVPADHPVPPDTTTAIGVVAVVMAGEVGIRRGKIVEADDQTEGEGKGKGEGVEGDLVGARRPRGLSRRKTYKGT